MKRKELEEREKKLEANRREQLLQETRNMLAEMDMGFGPAVAARNGEETMTEQGDTMAAARRDNDEATVAAVRRNDDEAAMTATAQNNGEAAMAVEKHDDDDEMGNREDDMMAKTGRRMASEIERVSVPGSQEGTIPTGATSVETLTVDKTGATTGTIEAETYDSQVHTTEITRDGMRSEVTRRRESTYYKRQPSYWNHPDWTQRLGTRRNHLWRETEDCRTRKVWNPTEERWIANTEASQSQVSWYSMCNSEDEGDKRESHAGTPPGIKAEKASPHDQRQNKQDHFNKKEYGQADMQGEGETGDRLLEGGDYEQGVTNLETRVKMLEEQIRGIYYKMGEMMGSDEASMDEGNLGCRRETDGEEWQRWNGSWWIRVEQQNLNSRQRRKISRGLRRMITREQNGMANLLKELRNEIRAEVEETTRRHLNTFSDDDELSRNHRVDDDTHALLPPFSQCISLRCSVRSNLCTSLLHVTYHVCLRGSSRTENARARTDTFTIVFSHVRERCEYWHPSECQFYKNETGCKAGDKCLFPHYKVDERQNKKPKKSCFPKKRKSDDKNAVAVVKIVSQLGCVSQDSDALVSQGRTSEKPDAESLGTNSKDTIH